MGTATLTTEAVCATPYKGISWALWEGNHLSEHGCPLAGATGMPTRHIAHTSLGGT